MLPSAYQTWLVRKMQCSHIAKPFFFSISSTNHFSMAIDSDWQVGMKTQMCERTSKTIIKKRKNNKIVLYS